MQTVFIEKPLMELRYERACLLIYEQGKRKTSLPLNQIDRVVVAPHISLKSGVLGVLAEQQIPLLVLNNQNPSRSALLSGPSRGDVNRRMRQYALHQDMAFRCRQAQRLVFAKVCRQYRFLARVKKSRADLRYPLTKTLATLQTILTELSVSDRSIDLSRLRGLEGAAAASYFSAYQLLFASRLQFTHRNRRPPKDPVNVCLSLGYTLLYHEAINALKAVGLDSALGCFHELYYQRDSLACDLIEPLRPSLDVWIYGLFQQRILRVEDFVLQPDMCEFEANGKRKFYAEYRLQASVFRRLLRRYAALAVKEVNGYEPS